MKRSLVILISLLLVAAFAAGCGGTSKENLAESRKRAKEQHKLVAGEDAAEADKAAEEGVDTEEATTDEKGPDDKDPSGQGEPAEEKPAEEAEEPKGDVENGKGLFVSSCGGCHALSDAGTAGAVGPKLDGIGWDFDQMLEQIQKGKGAMPGNLVTGDDADDVAAYVVSVTN